MARSVLRRELERSVRLPANEERWLPVGLVGGAAGYFIWLAGTGAAVPRAARAVLGPVSADPWTADTAVLAAAFAVLWVLVPSVVAVRFVLGHLTNLRGNIERAYRVDQPLVLLVPPLALLALVVAAGVVDGSVSTTLLAVGGAANAFLLVRTVAYGYRVYSFSVPRVLQASLFVAAVVASLAIVSRSGSLTGQTALVEAVADRYGVADLAFGEVSRGGVTAPTLPLVGAATPGVLALAYVWVQVFASLVVRMRRPDVPRSAVRAGQRYPAVVQPGTSRRLAMGTGSTGRDGDGNDSDGRDGDGTDATGTGRDGDVADDWSDEPGGPPEDGTGADANAGAAGAATDGSTSETVTGDAASVGSDPDPNGEAADSNGEAADSNDEAADSNDEAADSNDEAADSNDEAVDPVGRTRVYTPPEDADLSGDGANVHGDGPEREDAVKNELCPICGATFTADPDRTHCPNCNAVLDTQTGEG